MKHSKMNSLAKRLVVRLSGWPLPPQTTPVRNAALDLAEHWKDGVPSSSGTETASLSVSRLALGPARHPSLRVAASPSDHPSQECCCGSGTTLEGRGPIFFRYRNCLAFGLTAGSGSTLTPEEGVGGGLSHLFECCTEEDLERGGGAADRSLFGRE